MKPRISLDFLRGALALRALHITYSGLASLCHLAGAQWPSGHPALLPFSTVALVLASVLAWGFVLFTALYPSRPRLQAVFVLMAASVLMSVLCQFYWMRNLPPAVHPYSFQYGMILLDLAWTGIAWILYRRWPRT